MAHLLETLDFSCRATCATSSSVSARLVMEGSRDGSRWPRGELLGANNPRPRACDDRGSGRHRSRGLPNLLEDAERIGSRNRSAATRTATRVEARAAEDRESALYKTFNLTTSSYTGAGSLTGAKRADVPSRKPAGAQGTCAPAADRSGSVLRSALHPADEISKFAISSGPERDVAVAVGPPRQQNGPPFPRVRRSSCHTGTTVIAVVWIEMNRVRLFPWARRVLEVGDRGSAARGGGPPLGIVCSTAEDAGAA